jgi:ornithine decarboxylase
VIDTIGHLCDYILFDSAWVGYEGFIPMLKECSPLLLELDELDPGIFVTQSVHKQQAGFSQTSQIHKKDDHIKGQKRHCNHKHLNNAFCCTPLPARSIRCLRRWTSTPRCMPGPPVAVCGWTA